MTAADAGATYTVILDSTTDPLSGHVNISGDGGNFEIDWDNAATTVDPAWFGGRPAEPFLSTASSAAYDLSGAASYKSLNHSSLLWFPGEAFASYPPGYDVPGRGLSFSSRSISGRYQTTRTIYRRGPTRARTYSEMLSSNWDDLTGGRGSLTLLNLEEDQIGVVYSATDTDNFNSGIVGFWHHAMQGKWFVVWEDVSGASLAAADKIAIARLDFDPFQPVALQPYGLPQAGG